MIPLRDIFKISSIPVVIASLCGLSPIIMMLFGLSSPSIASSLAQSFSTNYEWAFRSAGVIALIIAIIVYLRHTKGICTFDEVQKSRMEILNIIVVSTAVAVTGYAFLLYGVINHVGKLLKLWS